MMRRRCCNCFSCRFRSWDWIATGDWTVSGNGGTASGTSGSLTPGFIATRGYYCSFDYSFSGGTLGIGGPGISIDSDGTLSTSFGPTVEGVPTSGTMEIWAASSDPILEAAGEFEPNATEIIIGGSPIISLPGSAGQPIFSLTGGGSATISNFTAQKIYEGRNCLRTGAYPWPVLEGRELLGLTIDVTFRNRLEPIPGESELPCDSCGGCSGTYPLTRVHPEDLPVYSSPDWSQLWITSGFGCGCDDSGELFVGLGYNGPGDNRSVYIAREDGGLQYFGDPSIQNFSWPPILYPELGDSITWTKPVGSAEGFTDCVLESFTLTANFA